MTSLDVRLAARACIALIVVNMRYWTGVAPLVRTQLERWRAHAERIDDPVLRVLALEKLDAEGFNAEAAAMLATLAPRRHRGRAVEAMVAVEVMYDYLDGLTESVARASPRDGARLFAAFTDAVVPSRAYSGDYYGGHAHAESCYLEALVRAARQAISGLPAASELAGVLEASAARGGAAQLRIHAAPTTGTGALERWAKRHAKGTALHWREFLAGAACSVLAVHALIAAACDNRTTRAQGQALDRIYLSIAALPTVLDSVVDYEADRACGHSGYVRHYDDGEQLALGLASAMDDAIGRARHAPHAGHHVMALVGVVAYYASAPGAASDFARPVMARVGAPLQPMLAPPLAMMRGWRAAKRLRRGCQLDAGLAP